VGPEAGLDRCGKSRPTGIRSPDLPARSESLYRLRYPGSPTKYYKGGQIKKNEMGGSCGTCRGEKMCIQGFCGKTWGKETTWKT
jgi:hypothetical protein